MPKIRTTIRPTEELDVDETEAASLRAQGLVLEGTRATTEQGLLQAAQRQTAANTPAPGDPSASTDDQPEG